MLFLNGRWALALFAALVVLAGVVFYLGSQLPTNLDFAGFPSPVRPGFISHGTLDGSDGKIAVDPVATPPSKSQIQKSSGMRQRAEIKSSDAQIELASPARTVEQPSRQQIQTSRSIRPLNHLLPRSPSDLASWNFQLLNKAKAIDCRQEECPFLNQGGDQVLVGMNVALKALPIAVELIDAAAMRTQQLAFFSARF